MALYKLGRRFVNDCPLEDIEGGFITETGNLINCGFVPGLI